jgi:hypothetical protein
MPEDKNSLRRSRNRFAGQTGEGKFYLIFIIVMLGFFIWRGFVMWEERNALSLLLNSYPTLLKHDQDDHYHDTEQILDQVYYMNDMNPFYCSYTIKSLFEDEEQQSLYSSEKYDEGEYKTLAFGPCAGNDDHATLRVGIICGQHGRELISPELCYHLIKLIQTQVRHESFTTRIAELRSKGVVFWILPIVNEWAREQIELDKSKSCLRKNAAGVDLNRNFKCPDFIRASMKNPKTNPEYPGKEDFSEVESKITDAFLAISQPHLLMNVHSGAEKILLPYDCCEAEIPEHYSLMARVASLSKKKVSSKYNFKYIHPKRWQVGKSSLLLYSSHSTLMDYAEAIYKIPLVYTLEIYESLESDNNVKDIDMTPEQCRKWYNPEEGEEYTEVITAWIDQIITMVEKTQQRIKTSEQK